MSKSGMIEDTPLTFEEVIDGVRNTEQQVNALTAGRTAPIQRTP